MSREAFLSMAAQGLAMPIGTDLVLHERPDPEAVRIDGEALGEVVVEAARRWETPLAIPLMDLRLEKRDLLAFLGVEPAVRDAFHLREVPPASTLAALALAADRPFPAASRAQQDALRYVRRYGHLIATGMVIGPFSLATKLMEDPIPAVALAGRGIPAEEDPNVLLFERCLAMAELTVARSVRFQLDAGAQAILVCEPAASTAYISPRQMKGERHLFHNFVLEPHLRLKAMAASAGADYLFHDCGELSPDMVRLIGTVIHPTMLSLGSSRMLWEDASLVPDDVVLFGNLPTRRFPSDASLAGEQVIALVRELRGKMVDCGHPHILGSECDVLHVSGSAGTIRRKVELMLEAARSAACETDNLIPQAEEAAHAIH